MLLGHDYEVQPALEIGIPEGPDHRSSGTAV